MYTKKLAKNLANNNFAVGKHFGFTLLKIQFYKLKFFYLKH